MAHGVASWVLSDGRVMNRYQDGSANVWGGSSSAFIVSFKNNNGSWKIRTDGWAWCPLPNGISQPNTGPILAIGGFSIYDAHLDGAQPTFYGEPGYGQPMNVQVPSGGQIPPFTQLPSTSLQAMTGPDGFQIVDHPAHGLRDCSVHNDGSAVCSFEDGEGNIWYGSSGVFGLLCGTRTGDPGGTPAGSGSTVWALGTSGGSGGSGGGSGSGGSGSGGDGGKPDPDPGQPVPVLPISTNATPATTPQVATGDK